MGKLYTILFKVPELQRKILHDCDTLGCVDVTNGEIHGTLFTFEAVFFHKTPNVTVGVAP